ncbi:uncharacterized protein [Dysidea avara]|uniref:uncharacterized protein isoform X5 n=1 Tax=Dysidea avara TaxID=196820 RepID=UPI00332887D5
MIQILILVLRELDTSHTEVEKTQRIGSKTEDIDMIQILILVQVEVATGNRAGLQTSKVSRAENDEMRQRRERELKDMDPSMLGKEADTVYSDKHGRRIYPKLEKVDKGDTNSYGS